MHGGQLQLPCLPCLSAVAELQLISRVLDVTQKDESRKLVGILPLVVLDLPSANHLVFKVLTCRVDAFVRTCSTNNFLEKISLSTVVLALFHFIPPSVVRAVRHEWP